MGCQGCDTICEQLWHQLPWTGAQAKGGGLLSSILCQEEPSNGTSDGQKYILGCLVGVELGGQEHWALWSQPLHKSCFLFKPLKVVSFCSSFCWSHSYFGSGDLQMLYLYNCLICFNFLSFHRLPFYLLIFQQINIKRRSRESVQKITTHNSFFTTVQPYWEKIPNPEQSKARKMGN